MNTATGRTDGAVAPGGAALAGGFALLGGLGLLHAAMLAYDVGHPDRFLNADRASSRMQVIEGFAETWRTGGDLSAYIAGHGIVGDWLPHALLFLAGGAALVILVQVLLALASVAWVREIGVRTGLDERHAGLAALVYGLLPHTLVFPHQLSTEALFVPLVVLSFVLVLRAAHPAAGAAIGVATLVRPITLLWPVLQAACARRAPRTGRLLYLAAALAPLLGWMTFVSIETGVFSMGPSKHDLGHNLYMRVQRMAPALPEAERFGDRADPRLGVGEYAGFVAAHPGLAAAHSARDLMAMSVKSGVERIVLDYLDFYPDERRGLQDPNAGWRKNAEKGGPVAALRAIAGEHPFLFIVSAAGALLFAGLMVLAALGALAHARAGSFMLAGYVLYVIVTAQAVDAAQSRHRAPAEFALCVLAAAGAAWLRKKGTHGR
jgi:hypothetical protein